MAAPLAIFAETAASESGAAEAPAVVAEMLIAITEATPPSILMPLWGPFSWVAAEGCPAPSVSGMVSLIPLGLHQPVQTADHNTIMNPVQNNK